MDINSLPVIFSPPLFCRFCSITANFGAAAGYVAAQMFTQQTRPAAARVPHSNEIKLYEVSSNECFFSSEPPTSNINTGM